MGDMQFKYSIIRSLLEGTHKLRTQRWIEVKKLIPVIALLVLVMILAGSSASAVFDTGASLTDSNIPDNEITTSPTQATNSSASGTITITMYAVADE